MLEEFDGEAWQCVEGAVPEWECERPFPYPCPEARSYRFFGALAGVRNYEEVAPAFPYRGTPQDISSRTTDLLSVWEYDGHSHTHATVKEIMREAEDNEHIARSEFYQWLRGPLVQEPVKRRGAANVRVIMWFDN